MTRYLRVGAAQLGPVGRDMDRAGVVQRLCRLMRDAGEAGCDVVVYPELALTPFFPRWYLPEVRDLDAYFETDMPGEHTRPLFEEAARLGVGFYLGYAERVQVGAEVHRFNTAVLVGGSGEILGRYRKIHLPGHHDYRPEYPYQHLEKRYFEIGDLGFPVFEAFGARVGMCLCNDRRWPETYRVLALGGAELIFIGYNTPAHFPTAPHYDHLSHFHNHLVMQAGAYQNACWVVGVAKAGVEDGCHLIAGSCVIGPSGEIVAEARTESDELIVADCDLDECAFNRTSVFDFEAHRVPEAYQAICQRRTARPKVITNFDANGRKGVMP